MSKIFSLFLPGYPKSITYMLQSTEYNPSAYLAWFWRTEDFRYKSIAKRRELTYTKAARLILVSLKCGIGIQIMFAIIFSVIGMVKSDVLWLLVGFLSFLTYPIIWAHVVLVPLFIGRLIIVKPNERRLITLSKRIFAEHPGIIIAVAGSYGKTTTKEILRTVLSKGKNVAATPANKNVAISHALFAKKLKGNEDILIIEYGEGEPGDVERFTDTTKPDYGIITGIAPAHLDKYKTLENAASDIFSLANKLDKGNVFVNADSELTKPYIKDGYIQYDSQKVLGWAIQNVSVQVDNVTFTMKKGNQTLRLKSHMIGRHLVGTLAMVAALALELGLTKEQVTLGISQTKPFEHRMQSRLIAGGWVVDDTYNGNLEGIRAGLELLSELSAKRKIYVTPGLVDQGKESQRVHVEIGECIARANPDKVILMNNSVTKWIQHGIEKVGYTGEVIIEDDPLTFYSNLDQVIAVGDVLLMQNDWTDNYN